MLVLTQFVLHLLWIDFNNFFSVRVIKIKLSIFVELVRMKNALAYREHRKEFLGSSLFFGHEPRTLWLTPFRQAASTPSS
jgi:hypothetical protein